MVGLEIMHIGDIHHTTKVLEVETEVTLTIENITGTTCEVIRGIETITMIMGETIMCQSTIDYPACRCWTFKHSDSIATNHI